jgi:cytochrome c553
VVASGTMAAVNTVGTLSLSPYVTAGAIYGTGYNSSTALPSSPDTTGTSLVTSPIATACFGCHDGQTSADPSLSVKAHIESNGGGSIYQTRATALTRQESCLLCHGPTQVVPIKAAHGL